MLTADRDVVEADVTPGARPADTTSRLSGNSVPTLGPRTTSNRGQVLPGEARPSRPCAAGASNSPTRCVANAYVPLTVLGLTGLGGVVAHVLSWAIRVGAARTECW